MEIHLLKDLAVVMGVAGAMTLVCHRLKQPVVIGYLIAGLVVGPFTPPFQLVSNLQSIHTMAELGLVFLLFSLGLEFNLPKIRKVGLSAGLAAILEVVSMLTIGYLLGQAFGWSKMDSIFLGALLSMSSTTIIVKVFMDFKMIHEKFAQVVFGILVLEDIVAIAFLSILSGLATQGGPDAGTIVFSFLRIGLFIVLFLVIGLLLIPRFMHWVAHFKSKEALGVVTLGLCLGGSIVAAYYDLSVALGAFLTGAVLAATKEIDDIEEWIHPVRDMFSAIFFVSAGMLIQPQLLWEFKGPILIVTLVTLFGKVLSGAVGCYLAGYDMKTSARVGMSLAQIGEFSFVIASLGLSLKVTSDFLYPLAVMVSSLTTLATPYLIKRSDSLVDTFLGALPVSVRNRMLTEKPPREHGHGTAIISKYLVRLGVYVALLVADVAFVNGLALYLRSGETPAIILWTIASFLSLPLFMAISKYTNHIVLLLVTRKKTLLHYINVHSFYNTMNGIIMLLLVVGYLLAAARFIDKPEIVIALGLFLFFVGRFFQKRITIGKEWLESTLDQVIGIATSEPTRQAVLKSGDGSLRLVDITDHVPLSEKSGACYKTIRELNLRGQTGASIVAIYRQGNHLANPGPDTQLLPDDVLILLGNKEELEKANEKLHHKKTQ